MELPQSAQGGHAIAASSQRRYSPIVELRQYTLRPGQRDTLIDLFEREFIESQEAVGMHVIGQFRDLDDPDRFVWLRGFPDMVSRRDALHAFYREGPAWKAHHAAANATMIDSDNVLLLRPASPTAGFLLDPRDRPSPGVAAGERGLVTATIVPFKTGPEDDVLGWFTESVAPALTASGATVLAEFVTEPSENTFPALPVREGEHMLVWFSGYPDAASYHERSADLARSPQWKDTLWKPMLHRLNGEVQILKLAPTARSLLHG